jgi:hypothetical protein
MKAIIYLIFIAFVFLFIKFAFNLVLTKLYFPNMPQTFNSYVIKNDEMRTESEEQKIQLVTGIPKDGCYDTCHGRIEAAECQDYNDHMDYCIMKCYGYIYNNCKSGYGEMLIMFLTR